MTDLRTLRRHRTAVGLILLGTTAAFFMDSGWAMSAALAGNAFIWCVALADVSSQIRKSGRLDITEASARRTNAATGSADNQGVLMDKN